MHFLHLPNDIEISLLLLFHFLFYHQVDDPPTFFVGFELLQEIIGFHHEDVCFITDTFHTHGIFPCVVRFFLRDILFTEDLAAANQSNAEGFDLKPIVWFLGGHYALGGDCLVAVGTLRVARLVLHAMTQELSEIRLFILGFHRARDLYFLGHFELSVLDQVNVIAGISFAVDGLIPNKTFLLENVIQLIELHRAVFGQERDTFEKVNQFLGLTGIDFGQHLGVAAF